MLTLEWTNKFKLNNLPLPKNIPTTLEHWQQCYNVINDAMNYGVSLLNNHSLYDATIEVIATIERENILIYTNDDDSGELSGDEIKFNEIKLYLTRYNMSH